MQSWWHSKPKCLHIHNSRWWPWNLLLLDPFFCPPSASKCTAHVLMLANFSLHSQTLKVELNKAKRKKWHGSNPPVLLSPWAYGDGLTEETPWIFWISLVSNPVLHLSLSWELDHILPKNPFLKASQSCFLLLASRESWLVQFFKIMWEDKQSSVLCGSWICHCAPKWARLLEIQAPHFNLLRFLITLPALEKEESFWNMIISY